MAYKHLKDDTDKKLLKFNQLNDRLIIVSQEKEKINYELEKLKEKHEKMEK